LQNGKLPSGKRFPDGSIIFKDIRTAGGVSLLYAVMYKQAGNPLARSGWLSACGGPGSTVSPTPVQVTVTALAIFGPQVVPTGSNVTYGTTATLSSGTAIMNGRSTIWNSDNADVATINSAADGIGELTARREGDATITATYQGKSGTFTVKVRDGSKQEGAAYLSISDTPDPVSGSPMRCSQGPDPNSPTWTFTESLVETHGVGFTRETVTFNLYGDDGKLIYTDTGVEKDYFAAHSAFAEQFCTSLFGHPSGFYSGVYEGVDDRGNRLAFTNGRLRLLPVAGSTTSSWTSPVPLGAGAVVRGARRRVR
jgi:hypothetical protein